ncbi:ABC transporter permease [Palleronia sediminis]|uniref:ABC transporter permease n=1 Tax=Palleronia sediminis TaxID=2547833 RepID=A0A4V3B8R6_9RHOB|nr:ABC transporter permease [Palleronia sediminis]TDL76609.1 ABC transporter permease [Palleronia sediminis]
MTYRSGTPANVEALDRPDKVAATLVRLRRMVSWHVIAPPLVFFAILLVVGIANPAYLGPFGISIATTSAAPILLVALGQAMVLNTGSIDLSNAAIALFGAIIFALTIPDAGIVAMIAVLIVLTLIGAVNGAILAYTQVPSFALTLGTLGILQTAALVTSGSETIYVSENRDLVTALHTIKVLSVPLTFWIGVFAAIFFWALLRFTIIGQNMTAVGKNESGAILSAVPNKQAKIIAFAISGFASGLAGLAIVAQAGSASASGLGSNLLLPGIAAALVGGTSISGGQANPINVVFGALTVAFVPIAAQALGFGAQAQSLVYGIFIIVIVALTTSRTRGAVIK